MKQKLLILFLIIITAILFFFFGYGKGFYKIINKDSEAVEDFVRNDTLKARSINYLIENSEDKYTSLYIDAIKLKDRRYVRREYLFDNINQAIEQSYGRINKGEYTRDQFLNYVLPYRIRNERLEDWRKIAIDSFGSCYDDNIITYAQNINEQLKNGFRYKGRWPNRRFSELVEDKYGTCSEMSEIAAFAMRGNGIPVAIDFAKWSNLRSGHQWNALITKENNFPFLGCEENPNPDRESIFPIDEYRNVAKVYRKSFIKYDPGYNGYNPKKQINKDNYSDVTKEYCPDCKNITINLEEKFDNEEVFFLCIYEVDNWVPVDFAYPQDNTIKFYDVCQGNILTLKRRINRELVYYKSPFLFDELGKVSFLDENECNYPELSLNFENSPDRELIKQINEHGWGPVFPMIDSILTYNFSGTILPKNSYTLYFWKNNGWKEIGQQVSTGDSVIFYKVPKNVLYKLEAINDSLKERNRCFTVNEDLQQYWW